MCCRKIVSGCDTGSQPATEPYARNGFDCNQRRIPCWSELCSTDDEEKTMPASPAANPIPARIQTCRMGLSGASRAVTKPPATVKRAR